MSDDINDLVEKIVKYNDSYAMIQLEEKAKPLLKRFSIRFSNYHQKFEYDDFYSIAKIALYKACLKYETKQNNSFLNFAKLFILRDLWKEVSYWNFEKRNIFTHHEENLEEFKESLYQQNDTEEKIILKEYQEQIKEIIAENFNSRNQMILKLYLFKQLTITEISVFLNIKYKSVYSVVMRGQKLIIKFMRKQFL
ncbi:hypothetical protein [Chengkuizengella axinellae]|uniref:Sigma-70 family RNA polymerase sigma factor n=1 Tax=Chengkuizengella axinellae TaxID=3064388 RepID=A0ABT9IX53_9BACL|nr:hypothetical protein [Chengkuizengella sp. 2205SS18-9]MDP5273692.1 hypothetical protein [Chengkuizengella sp. 2205SS18-9]